MSDTVINILSIIGAAAWIPVLFTFVANRLRRVRITLLDSRILHNATSISAGREKQKKDGTILMLVLNIYLKEITFFAKDITANIYLKNGTKLKTEILAYSTLSSINDDGTKSSFEIDVDVEFNISRTIRGNVDNIKYVAFLVENGSFTAIDDVSKIEIILWQSKYFRKKAVITDSEFPRFNSNMLIRKSEKVSR